MRSLSRSKDLLLMLLALLATASARVGRVRGTSSSTRPKKAVQLNPKKTVEHRQPLFEEEPLFQEVIVPSGGQRRLKSSKAKSSKGGRSGGMRGKSKGGRSGRSGGMSGMMMGMDMSMGMMRMRRMMRPTSAPFTSFPTAATPGTTPAPSTATPGTTPAPTTPGPTTPGTTPSPTTASPGATPPPTPATTTVCTSNPQDYNVNIDVQIEFPDDEFAACDDEAQDSAINTNIQAALNENFATTVTGWQGTATFGEFAFDIDQEINNVDPFGGFRRLAKLAEFPIQRNLQTGTCPSRAAVDCTADYCRWGCLTAATFDCGDPASTTDSWTALAEDVRARLAGLGFDCLGIADQLNVVLVVDDPAAAARSVPGLGTATRAGPGIETVKLNDFDAAAADDESTETIPVASKLVFRFFPGKGRAPSTEEIESLKRETEAFFRREFQANTGFSTVFQEFQMTQLTPMYDTETSPDEFTLEFMSLVVLDGEAVKRNKTHDVSGTQALSVMRSSKFRNYIGKYARNSGPDFHETSVVHFTGVAHSKN